MAATATATETTITELPPPTAPEPEAEVVVADVAVVETTKAEVKEKKRKKIAASVSFKEETNVVRDLPEAQRKALEELRKLVRDALDKHEFIPLPPPPPPPAPQQSESEPAVVEAEEKKTEEEKVETTPTVAEEVKTETVEFTEAEREKEVVESSPVTAVDDVAVEAVDDDGAANTVEAIEETIVAVELETEDKEATEKPAVVVVEEEKESETTEEVAGQPPPSPEEVFLWGIPLLGDDRSDTILLKFLRARDFKVKEALAMLKNTVRWREELGVEALLEEDLGSDYENVVFVHGFDKEKRPVLYNVFGEFQNKELYQNTFSDAEKQKKFLMWLVQFLERTARKFDFGPTGINSLVLVNDLKNSPGYDKWDLYKVANKFLQLLQDNYPEFVAKQVCINVSWWYLAYSWVYISVFTPRSKSKFVFASTNRTAETLFKYIAPEHVPVQYGGHSRAGELEFTTEDPVIEVNIKPNSKHVVEFEFTEPSVLVWELRVVGWDVTYEAQFVPAEGYTVLVSKPKKLTLADDPIITDSFKITELGKVVLSIDNQSSKRRKFLYRSKIKSS
ncbi:Patellin-3-like protein, partial [Drosera capensis]